ncbi:unnamed protein product [Ixodes pacificus]
MLHPTGRFAARLGSLSVMTIHEHRKRSVPRSEQECSLSFSATAAGQGEGHHCGRVMTCDGGHHRLSPSPPPLLRCCCCCWTSRDEKENCRHSLAGDCARGGALSGRQTFREPFGPAARDEIKLLGRLAWTLSPPSSLRHGGRTLRGTALAHGRFVTDCPNDVSSARSRAGVGGCVWLLALRGLWGLVMCVTCR